MANQATERGRIVERIQGLEKDQAANGQGPLSFFAIYLLTGLGLWLVSMGGFYTLLAPVGLTFVAVPILDVVIGVDTRNASEAAPSAFKTALFRLATWLALPLQGALLIWGAAFVTKPTASLLELIGVVVAVGTTGGVIGITVAHELAHRASRLDRTLGKVLLVLVCYFHWATEHVAGHHRRVATREDPATARLGEALPVFLMRSVAQTFVSSWQIEATRNARRGVQSRLKNPVLWGVLGSCSLAAVLCFSFGWPALWFFFAQSAVAIAFLETINYIEHYGLERRQLRPGVYERVTPLHSWNASQWLTNVLLFNLQRHSDHHAWPTRPYYKLRHHPQAPQLPTGYAGMALLAMVPPLWRRVMDPRVAAHRAMLAAEAPTTGPN
ncbi:MAG TPA: alkane 1-monooxygenase [Polyangiaceae bacterium]|nr:alkane 1-monooxygenase [Polyangiaceae bacterium]